MVWKIIIVVSILLLAVYNNSTTKKLIDKLLDSIEERLKLLNK